MEWIKKFFKEEEGTEVVEWALVLGLIIVGAVALFGGIGTSVTSAWQAIADAF
jgi:pilus assembly protein Flp/PilA